jgi:hypothetical protein
LSIDHQPGREDRRRGGNGATRTTDPRPQLTYELPKAVATGAEAIFRWFRSPVDRRQSTPAAAKPC